MIRIIPAAVLAAMLAALIYSGWTSLSVSSSKAGTAMRLEVDPEPLLVETTDGKISFQIEVADVEEERSRGLMFRRDLPAGRGMLFVFENNARRGFWMRNTPLPLDLLFISQSGRVVAIRQGVPFSETAISPVNPVRFVLELHKGSAERNGIKIGARLRHRIIDTIAD